MIREAIRQLRVSVLHLATMFKVDVFMPRLDIVPRRELARGLRIEWTKARASSSREGGSTSPALARTTE
jgi:hypothetical protein